MLLSEPGIVDFLKNDVIPSWENVREPIKVTLDMGDGRAERRTIGGNTIMYIVSPDGTVADAFPGVYRADDVMVSLQAAASVAMKSRSERTAYHKERLALALSARVNTGKMMVEAPLLDALGAGNEVETPTPSGVLDLSHLSRDRNATRQLTGIPQEASDELAALIAVTMDSRINVETLRPKVHEVLAGEFRSPTEWKLRMFKELLGVPIDDPNLGISTVVTPGARR